LERLSVLLHFMSRTVLVFFAVFFGSVAEVGQAGMENEIRMLGGELNN
jgi:hypothetical protein